jgi:hypothetical protein
MTKCSICLQKIVFHQEYSTCVDCFDLMFVDNEDDIICDNCMDMMYDEMCNEVENQRKDKDIV